MRNGTIHIIACVLLLGIGFISCRTQKDASRISEVQTRMEKIERSQDTLRLQTTSTSTTTRQIHDLENDYSRIIEFDSLGRVHRVSETWRDRRSSDLSLQDNRTDRLSLSGSNSEVVQRDSSTTTVHEKTHVTTDTRPVQGVEWVWVILSIVLVVAVVIHRIVNKR